MKKLLLSLIITKLILSLVFKIYGMEALETTKKEVPKKLSCIEMNSIKELGLIDQNLTALNAQLSFQDIDEVNLKLLCDSLEKCKNLEVFILNIGINGIGDSGVKLLASALLNFNHLKYLHLNLESNNIKDIGDLANSLAGLKEL